MSFNPWGTVAALLSLLVFWIFCFRSFRWPSAERKRRLIIALVLAIPGGLYALHYLHLYQTPIWFYEWRSWPGTELLTVFVGVAGGIMAGGASRAIRAVLFLGVFCVSVLPYVKPIIRPLDAKVLRDQWNGRVCMQSTESTCGPASAASVVRAIGGNVSETDLARRAISCSTGTEAWYLARALRHEGYRVKFLHGDTIDWKVLAPCVMGVKLPGGAGHFISVLQLSGDRLLVGDPLIGEVWMPVERFPTHYEATGFYLLIRRKDQ